MGSNYMSTVRLATFSTTLVFSLIVLALSADFISLIGSASYFGFSGLALATSLLSLLTIGPMLFVDLYRSGSLFSYIIVEISWLSFLWILWLSTGSYSASTDSLFFPEATCDFGIFGSDADSRVCHEIKAIVAFSFLTWILLMVYTVTLLVLALRARSQGHDVWQTGVRDGTLFYPSEKVVGGAAPPMAAPQPAVYQSYPPPVQQSLPTSVSHTYTGSPQV